jgi:hypothetical protein
LQPHGYRAPELALAPANDTPLSLAAFAIDDLVGTLFELKILSLPNNSASARRRR